MGAFKHPFLLFLIHVPTFVLDTITIVSECLVAFSILVLRLIGSFSFLFRSNSLQIEKAAVLIGQWHVLSIHIDWLT